MAKVLIVDDETPIRRTLKEILEFEKFKVEEASDGLECLVQLKKNQYDVILMDIKMPKMDGYTLVRRLKKEDETKEGDIFERFGQGINICGIGITDVG